MFDSNERVLRSAGPNQLIEFGLDRGAIAVLRVLDQKDHQESNDSRSCLDNELPGVGKSKDWASDGPSDDNEQAQ
jgi:hypothetical protein